MEDPDSAYQQRRQPTKLLRRSGSTLTMSSPECLHICRILPLNLIVPTIRPSATACNVYPREICTHVAFPSCEDIGDKSCWQVDILGISNCRICAKLGLDE